MKEYNVFISRKAISDLRDIKYYMETTLTEKNVITNTISKLKNEITSLNTMPQRFPIISDNYLRALKIRKHICNNYIIFYNVDTRNYTVNVIRILQAKRNWELLLEL